MADHYTAENSSGRSAGPVFMAGQILPPMLLLPLFSTPFDIFVSLYWFIGGIAAIVSLTSLGNSFSGGDANEFRLRQLRPALTLLVFVAAASYMARTSAQLERKADAIGREVAAQMQHECQRLKKCPQAPAGWTIEHQRVFLPLEFMQLAYTTTDAQSRFTIRVFHRMEDELVIEGGVFGQLRESRRMN